MDKDMDSPHGKLSLSVPAPDSVSSSRMSRTGMVMDARKRVDTGGTDSKLSLSRGLISERPDGTWVLALGRALISVSACPVVCKAFPLGSGQVGEARREHRDET